MFVDKCKHLVVYGYPPPSLYTLCKKTTTLPTSCASRHGLGAYFLNQSVGNRYRLLAGPRLLHLAATEFVRQEDY